MKKLSPTLWRTCRALSGKTRLRLLRHLLAHPGQNVSQMADALGIGVSDASQELRRLQSRGLLRRCCQGRSVFYQATPDPQVSMAAPLLRALRNTLSVGDDSDEMIMRITTALAHERRVDISRILIRSPKTMRQLCATTQSPLRTLHWHVKLLMNGGYVVKEGKKFAFHPSSHSLIQTLIKLL